MTPVPNQPKTPQRTFRIPDPVYKAAQEKARERGESLTAVIVAFLVRYARKK